MDCRMICDGAWARSLSSAEALVGWVHLPMLACCSLHHAWFWTMVFADCDHGSSRNIGRSTNQRRRRRRYHRPAPRFCRCQRSVWLLFFLPLLLCLSNRPLWGRTAEVVSLDAWCV